MINIVKEQCIVGNDSIKHVDRDSYTVIRVVKFLWIVVSFITQKSCDVVMCCQFKASTLSMELHSFCPHPLCFCFFFHTLLVTFNVSHLLIHVTHLNIIKLELWFLRRTRLFLQNFIIMEVSPMLVLANLLTLINRFLYILFHWSEWQKKMLLHNFYLKSKLYQVKFWINCRMKFTSSKLRSQVSIFLT